MDFVVIIALAAPLAALTGYVESRLILSWRTYLTQALLAAYFSDRAFFNIKQVCVCVVCMCVCVWWGWGRVGGLVLRCCGGVFLCCCGALLWCRAAVVLPDRQLCAARRPARPRQLVPHQLLPLTQAGEGLTGVDNPDQRVCDDVRAFVDSSVAIVVAVVLKAFKVVAFAGGAWGWPG
jgi:hypothetical protein